MSRSPGFTCSVSLFSANADTVTNVNNARANSDFIIVNASIAQMLTYLTGNQNPFNKLALIFNGWVNFRYPYAWKCLNLCCDKRLLASSTRVNLTPLNKPHIFSIPVDHFILKIAFVTGQSRRRRPEPEYGIFNDGLAKSDTVEEAVHMVDIGIITIRGTVCCTRKVLPLFIGIRPFSIVGGQQAFLHIVGIGGE